ncbi:MAG: phytanoyl-CoA dioxygenase [Flavobacteriaceae bacterium]|nr:phytanoyl-CoA dioxygenase [Flavobacteriaceae bacterium]
MNDKLISTDIKQHVLALLDDTSNQEALLSKIKEIHNHFQQATEITGFDNKMENLAAVPTAKGKALGLNHAAQCLLDYKRTPKFLKAMITAIKEKQEQYPEETIKIFYAGCGPYAPFVTLIAPLFSPEEIQFSLLEINPGSLDSAKKLINAMELHTFIQEEHLADAVTFSIPNPKQYHILFSETLDALLFRECYVPIVFNMLPQLRFDITLIPENVVIDLSLTTGLLQDEDREEYKIDTIVDVRKAHSNQSNTTIPSQLEEVKVSLENYDMNKYQFMTLDTSVHVYKDIWLTRAESSLTLPLDITLEQPFINKSIVFNYQIDPDIELKCTLE